MSRPGKVLVPADPLQPVQFIDVRDLAGWTIDQVEAGRGGTVHATGPRFRWGFRDWLEAIRQTLSSEAEPVWAPSGILARPEVPPDTGLPFILPDDSRGLFAMDVGRAFRWGLSPRPMAETIRDTLAWFRAEHPDASHLEECLKTRLPDGLEEKLLADLSSQPSGGR
jgi:2'-hydroxyisoflavone reductase